MGSFNWLSTHTRPDITQAVNKLCEANANPSPIHTEAVKRLLRYLKGTGDWGIVLGGPEFTKEELGLQIYADAAFGDDPIRRFSTGPRCSRRRWASILEIEEANAYDAFKHRGRIR